MFASIKLCLELLGKNERRTFLFLMCLTTLVGIFDVAGVIATVTFISVAINSALVNENYFLSVAFDFFNKNMGWTGAQFILVLGWISLLTLLVSIFYRAAVKIFHISFSHRVEQAISFRLFQNFLNKDYLWFVSQNSADLSKVIVSEVNTFTSGGILPIFNMISQIGIITAFSVFLAIVNPKTLLVILAFFSIFYFTVGIIVAQKNRLYGKERFFSNSQRFAILDEAFGAFKAIKTSGLEKRYTNFFRAASKRYERSRTWGQIIGVIPRFFLEAFAFGGLLLAALLFLGSQSELASGIPAVLSFTMAGYRVLPGAQQIYSANVQLKYLSETIRSLREFSQLDPYALNSHPTCEPVFSDRYLFSSEIVFDDVTLNYRADRQALVDVSLRIPVGALVGVVGSTGSGKSSFINLLLGLIEPTLGRILVDGNNLNGDFKRSWQKVVGYVPQEIFVRDGSVASNIAFGLDDNEIDLARVKTAARIADFDEFVTSSLPNAYDTLVGQNGLTLSGGERQRLAVARAIYSQPQVLVLDEATSALDDKTQSIVINNIINDSDLKTVIMVAHREETIRGCDVLFHFEGGRLIRSLT